MSHCSTSRSSLPGRPRYLEAASFLAARYAPAVAGERDVDEYVAAWSDDEPARLPTPPPVVAGRYRLGDKLGSGSHSVVYRALDRLTGEAVAVKLLRAGAQTDQRRREAVALRSLRVPGVAHLLDEGIADGWLFLVMDLVEGRPFPGVAVPAPWSALRATAIQLFEVLGRVHEAGVLHLDLKPANVQVEPDGTVVLLDLGLAGGPALGGAAPARCVGGTARYMAPEQHGAGRVDPRTDLHAAGLMLYQALTGVLPSRARGREYSQSMGPSLRQQIPDLPADVCETLASLLALAPDQRPHSAWTVLDRLDATVPRPEIPGDGESFTPARLEALFCGHERILHVPSDAARALHDRTGGVRSLVELELRRWRRLGVATRDGQGWRVERGALEWLEQIDALHGGASTQAIRQAEGAVAGGVADGVHATRVQLARLVVARAPGDVPATALALASKLLEHGDHARVRLALEHGLFAIRRGERPTGEEAALLSLYARTAIDQREPAGLQLALYHIGRATRRTSELEAMESLLRASLHAEQREPERAAEIADALPPFADPELELRRHTVRLRVAAQRPVSREAAVLDDALAWARRQRLPHVRARLLGWMGRLRYRQGRFDESALLHEQSVASAVTGVERLSSLLNGASSMMELGRYESAHEFAGEALDLARRHRHSLDEGRAEWLLRAISYRMGRAMEPDLELVEAAECLAIPYLVGLLAINEAAVAWRSGDLEIARRLAARARACFVAADIRGGRVLAMALELTCCERPRSGQAIRVPGRLEPGAPVIDELAREVLAQPENDIAWQVLGMLARLHGGHSWRATATRLARAAADPERRRELLAPREVFELRPGGNQKGVAA